MPKVKPTDSISVKDIPQEYIHEASDFYRKLLFGENPNPRHIDDLSGMEGAIIERATRSWQEAVEQPKSGLKEQQENLRKVEEFHKQQQQIERERQIEFKRKILVKCQHCHRPMYLKRLLQDNINNNYNNNNSGVKALALKRINDILTEAEAEAKAEAVAKTI